MDDEHGGVSGYAYNSNSCYGCHPTGSKGKSFDHAANGFPLTNGHSAVDCASCHTNGYAGTSNACASCHTNNYTQTTNPNHTAAGISNDCATCHTTIPGWKPATYPAHSDLVGVHVSIANDCAACHNGNYTVLPKTCNDCHASDFAQTNDPSHTAAQFPVTCADCHSQTSWKPSTFDHSTFYPLIGAHATIANNCLKCHASGYPNTPNTCEGCHTPDYNQTTNPNHTSAQFPKTCEDCHNQSAWAPANWDHDSQYFPIYSGKHNGEWNTCSDCHTTANNYSQFSCIDCHEHNKTDMDNEHQGEQGYTWTSAACYNCHPKGSN